MANRMPEWTSETDFRLDGVGFHAVGFPKGRFPEGVFTVMKSRQMVDAYVALVDQLQPRAIVELGVFAGGSTALLELLASPRKLVAFEVSPDPVEQLARFLEDREATDRIRPYYGVDQADTARLRSITREELGEGPVVDLVIDDASHDLELTRGSFDALFPMVRPGGAYVIEDWGWGHFPFARPRRGPSLAKLVLEAVLSVPFARGVIDRVVIDEYWAVVWRGSAPLPDGFELRRHLSPRAAQLLAVDDDDPDAPTA